MKKVFYLIIGLALILYAARSIYQVLSISSTLPPIIEYKYESTPLKLISGLKKYFLTHQNLILEGTDTVGNKKDGFAYHIRFSIKYNSHSLEYDVKCENFSKTDLAQTKVSLIGANDITNHTGGYGIKANGMKKLIDIFNYLILTPLQNTQHVKLVVL